MANASIILSSPFGPIKVLYRAQGIYAIRFIHHHTSVCSRNDDKKAPPVFIQYAKKWMQKYKIGTKLKPFPLKMLDLSQGTAFQQKVWRQLWKIPYGNVVSYSWIAKKIGNPQAARAVGQANNKNPIPILIPCHRVIAADGSIGGYASGILRKRKLLEIEGIQIK